MPKYKKIKTPVKKILPQCEKCGRKFLKEEDLIQHMKDEHSSIHEVVPPSEGQETPPQGEPQHSIPNDSDDESPSQGSETPSGELTADSLKGSPLGGEAEKNNCGGCGGEITGKPEKCPHCGEVLLWDSQ